MSQRPGHIWKLLPQVHGWALGVTMVAFHLAASTPTRMVTKRISHTLPTSAAANRRVAATRISSVHAVPHRLYIAGQPMVITNGHIRFTGTLHTWGNNFIVAALGRFHLGATKLAWSAAHPPIISSTGLAAQGYIHFWHGAKGIAHVHIHNGLAVFKTLGLKYITVSAGKINWALQNNQLTATAITANWKQTMIQASGMYNLSTRVGHVLITIPKFKQQRFFALLAPQRVNIQGLGNMMIRLTFNAVGDMTGSLNLAGLHAGYLQLHQVPLLREVLTGSYGQAMAAAMADDLHDYPFTQERVRVRLTRTGMIFKMDFIRGPGNPMHLKPRTVNIDGKKMLFRARDLKSIHLTIPVRNLTLRKLLALAQQFSKVSTTR